MIAVKVILVTTCLATIFENSYNYPIPGHSRHRLIIYVPFKVKILHHHKVEKVPVHIQKDIHYHYDDYDDGDESHFDEKGSNVIEDESYEAEDDNKEEKNSQNFHEDYKESQQWDTTNPNDYDYE